MQLLQQLLDQGQAEVFHNAWSGFFLDPEKVRQLEGIIDQDTGADVIKACAHWNGSGWNTGKASKRLHDLTSVPLVTADFSEYRNAFCYALALLWSLEVPQLDLSDRAAQGAFALAQRFQTGAVPVGFADTSAAHKDAAAEEPPAEDVLMEWDEPTFTLPQELATIWTGVQNGSRKLNLATLLDSVPKFAELPVRPAENNFRGQGRSNWDRQLRSYQQTILHLLRMWTTVYMTTDESEANVKFRMAWQLLGELFQKIQVDRKEHSLPGCVPSPASQLFGKDEVAQVNMLQKVNSAGKQQYWRGSFQGKGRFRPFTRYAVQTVWTSSTKITCPYRFSYKGRGFSHGGFASGGFSTPQKGKGKGVPQSEAKAAHLSSFQVEGENTLVGQEGSTTHFTTDHTWCVSRLARTRVRTSSLSQKSGRREGSQPANGRVCRTGSSPASFRHGQAIQVPDPLVPHQEGRCGGRRESEVDCRLQTIEPFPVSPPFQARPLGRHLSLLEERNVGGKGRPQTCILSLGKFRKIASIHENQYWGKSLPNEFSSLWAKCPPPTVYRCDEGTPKRLEKARFFGIRLFRRHPHFGNNQTSDTKSSSKSSANSGNLWVSHQSEEITLGTNTDLGTFGISDPFSGRFFGSASRKVEVCEKGARKIDCSPDNVPQKNGSNPWTSQVFFDCNALSQGFHQPNAFFCGSSKDNGMGLSHSSSTQPPGGSQENKKPDVNLERKNFPGSFSSQRTSLRFIKPCLGWCGFNWKTRSPGILEGQKWPPHKCERTFGSSEHIEKFGKTQGACDIGSRQFSSLQLPEERGGQKTLLEFTHARPLALVHGKVYPFTPHFGSFQGMSSRLFEQNPPGQRGLHTLQSGVPQTTGQFQGLGNPRLGHFCKPWKPQVPQVHLQVPPLASQFNRCSSLPLGKYPMLLCKPSMDLHKPMVTQTLAEQTFDLSDGDPPLGFSTMVAPFGKTQGSRQPSGADKSQMGPFHKFRRGENAPHQVAPHLHLIIRKKLEEQQISDEGIKAYLTSLPSMERYQSAFGKFWTQCQSANLHLPTASLWEIAAEIVKLNVVNKNEARNAYSALLCIPGMDQLRFSPLLRQVKKMWNQNVPKYPTFWSAADLLPQIARQPLNLSDVGQVRSRLILCWRLVQLARSIDLARLYRKISFISGKPFVWIHRKGWPGPRWEEVVCLPTLPMVCPWHLLKTYVSLTSSFVGIEPGSLVLRSLTSPFKPLTSNTIGSLTSTLLENFGISKNIWGPHSTRGAGVTMYKELGLSSEEVCEIGKWKNETAFRGHYLRMGAPKRAGKQIATLVHTVSSGGSATPDWSRTPGNGIDPGGSDQEGGAQTPDETTLFAAGSCS